jgi:hypothetical protein
MALTIDEIEALEVMCALAFDSKIKHIEAKEDDPEIKAQRADEYKTACAALARIRTETRK